VCEVSRSFSRYVTTVLGDTGCHGVVVLCLDGSSASILTLAVDWSIGRSAGRYRSIIQNWLPEQDCQTGTTKVYVIYIHGNLATSGAQTNEGINGIKNGVFSECESILVGSTEQNKDWERGCNKIDPSNQMRQYRQSSARLGWWVGGGEVHRNSM